MLIYTGAIDDTDKTAILPNRGIVREIYWNAGTSRLVIEADFDVTPTIGNVFSVRFPGHVDLLACHQVDRYNIARKMTLVAPNGGGQRVRDTSTDNVRQLRINIPPPVLPWAAATAYAVADIRSNAGNVYRCTVAGTSHATTGPVGFGTAIVEGGCTWTRIIQSFDVAVRAINTAYLLNAIKSNGNRCYIVTTAGTTGAGAGPTGTGTGIADGSVVWDYYPVNPHANVVVPIEGDVLSVTYHVSRAAIPPAGGLCHLYFSPTNNPFAEWRLDLEQVGTRRQDQFAVQRTGTLGYDNMAAFSSGVEYWHNLNMVLRGGFSTVAVGYVILEIADHM
jgi:hypothetical protein